MKALEWTSVTHEVRKRALEGKDSDVYLCGRRLDSKRVKRQVAYYESRIPGPDSETGNNLSRFGDISDIING
jgi:hypothetical protein